MVLVGCLVWPFAVHAENEKAEVFLETHRSEFQKIPIWIMGFAGSESPLEDDAGIGKQVDAILQADLRRTHVFKVMKRATDTLPLSKAGCQEKVPIVKAKASTAPVVTWGRIGRKDGKLLLEACAYDGGGTDLVAIGKRYTGNPINVRLLRSMVHRWADALVTHYTGDPGIARTEIMYVSEDKAGRRHIYKMDYDGFGPRRVSSDPILSLMPDWSPDRRAVVYTTYHGNNQEIVRLELGKKLGQGSKRTLVPSQILNITPGGFPEWTTASVCFRQGFRQEGELRHFYDEPEHGKENTIDQEGQCGIIARVVAGWTRTRFHIGPNRQTTNLYYEGRRQKDPPVDF